MRSVNRPSDQSGDRVHIQKLGSVGLTPSYFEVKSFFSQAQQNYKITGYYMHCKHKVSYQSKIRNPDNHQHLHRWESSRFTPLHLFYLTFTDWLLHIRSEIMCSRKQFSTAVSQQNFKNKTKKEGFQEQWHLFLGSSCVAPTPPPLGHHPH